MQLIVEPGAKPGWLPDRTQGGRPGDGVQVPPHGEAGAGRGGGRVVGGRRRRPRPAARHRHEGAEVVRGRQLHHRAAQHRPGGTRLTKRLT